MPRVAAPAALNEVMYGKVLFCEVGCEKIPAPCFFKGAYLA